jgi:hypothetical protein
MRLGWGWRYARGSGLDAPADRGGVGLWARGWGVRGWRRRSWGSARCTPSPPPPPRASSPPDPALGGWVGDGGGRVGPGRARIRTRTRTRPRGLGPKSESPFPPSRAAVRAAAVRPRALSWTARATREGSHAHPARPAACSLDLQRGPARASGSRGGGGAGRPGVHPRAGWPAPRPARTRIRLADGARGAAPRGPAGASRPAGTSSAGGRASRRRRRAPRFGPERAGAEGSMRRAAPGPTRAGGLPVGGPPVGGPPGSLATLHWARPVPGPTRAHPGGPPVGGGRRLEPARLPGPPARA